MGHVFCELLLGSAAVDRIEPGRCKRGGAAPQTARQCSGRGSKIPLPGRAGRYAHPTARTGGDPRVSGRAPRVSRRYRVRGPRPAPPRERRPRAVVRPDARPAQGRTRGAIRRPLLAAEPPRHPRPAGQGPRGGNRGDLAGYAPRVHEDHRQVLHAGSRGRRLPRSREGVRRAASPIQGGATECQKPPNCILPREKTRKTGVEIPR